MADDLSLAVGVELRAMRKRAGLSVRRFAALIDSHWPIVYRVEHGHHLAGLETCQLYAAVTGESLRGVTCAIDRFYGLATPRPRRVFARAPRS